MRQIRQPGGLRASATFEREVYLTKSISIILYVAVMIAVIVGVDVLFFRNRFTERLIANIGIVVVFAVFYLIFLKKP